MDSKFDTRKAYMLDSQGRVRDLKPDRLLKEVAGLKKGMTCVDLGCGSGVFSFPMADFIGEEGLVYAVDNSSAVLDYMRLKSPPPNLKLVHRDTGNTGLDSQIADFCLLASILHEVRQPQVVTDEAFRLLRPGGRAVVVEWKADCDSPGPPSNRRINKDQINRLFDRTGFSNFEYFSWSENHYVAVGDKISK